MKRQAIIGVLWVFVVVATLLAQLAWGSVELVRDGQPVSEIIVDSNALQVVKLAAQDLQKHVALISGATLPIVHAPTPNVKTHVYVGTNAYTAKLGFQPAAFSNSGFEIVAQDTYVILAGVDKQRKPSEYLGPEGLEKWHALVGEPMNYGRGGEGIGTFNAELGIWTNDDPGTWYAVAELLEQLGVRWYMPYEDGTVIPKKKTIMVADQHLKKEAAFARREFCFYNAMRHDGEGIAWFKRLKMGNNNIIVYNHTTDDIFGPKAQKELHPNYLAYDADGKPYGGYPDGHGMPRYTDPGFRKAAAIYLIKRFEVMPELTAISLSPPDGGLQMDARDIDRYGKPDDSMEQKASNYIWDFHVFLAHELKKAHPDKYLLYGNGSGAREIPTNIDEFPDNIIVPFAQPYSAYRVLRSTDREVIETRKRWHDKMRTVRKCPIWDYFLYYRTANNPRYPVVFTESLQLEVQEMLPYSDGKFIEIQPTRVKRDTGREAWQLNTPGLIHLMVYWHSKLFWDPDQDRQALLDEYYDLFFGPASAEMKAFYEISEKVWTRQESRSVTKTSGFLKESDVAQYFDLLARARKAAGADTVYERRIARIEQEMQPLKLQFDAFDRQGPNLHVYTPARSGIAPELDGDLNKPFWQKQQFWNTYTLLDAVTGEMPEKNRTSVSFRITENPPAFWVGIVCHESRMGQITTNAVGRGDRAISNDDTVEIYIATPERSYFRIVANPLGALWEESHDPALVERDTLPELWRPGTEAVARRSDDQWSLEIMIPKADFGTLGPTRNYPWGINVARTRRAGGTPERFALAPTGQPDFSDLSKMGNLARGDVARERWQESVPQPGFPGAFQSAAKRFAEKEYGAAQKAFMELAEKAPTAASKATCLARAALSLWRQGDDTNALKLAKSIAIAPVSACAQMEIMAEAKRYPELIKAFAEEDIAKWPDAINVRGFWLRGEAFAQTKDLAAAARDFAHSADLAGSDDLTKIEALQRTAGLRRALADADGALVALQQALDLFEANPRVVSAARWRYPSIVLEAAATMKDLGEYDAALAVLARYGNPDEPGTGDWWFQILEQYGDLYVAQGKTEQALKRYRQATETKAQAGFIKRAQDKIDITHKK